MTRRPQTTRPINPPAPRAAPACIRQGTGMTEQRHATLPIRHSRPKPSGTAAGIHLLCRCHGSSSLSPDEDIRGQASGGSRFPFARYHLVPRLLPAGTSSVGGGNDKTGGGMIPASVIPAQAGIQGGGQRAGCHRKTGAGSDTLPGSHVNSRTLSRCSAGSPPRASHYLSPSTASLFSMKWHGKKVKRTHDSSKYGPDLNESQTKIYCSNRSGFPDGTERQSAEAFFKRKGRRGDPPVLSGR